MGFRRKWLLGVLLGGLLVGGAVNAWVGGRAYRARGGEVPVPFDQLNQKVELAHGESYLLQGRVVWSNGIPFFEVDLDFHPWLASEARKRNPYYPLLTDTGLGARVDWRDWGAEPFRLTVRAHGRMIWNRNGDDRYVIALEVLRKPQRLKMKQRQKQRSLH